MDVTVVLERLAKEEPFTGAALVSRDGLTVRHAGRAEVSRETFSAMSATVMGAAEIALRELDGGATTSIIASTKAAVIVIVGATRDMLLVASARPDAPVGSLVETTQRAAAEVAKALAGG